MSQTTVTISGTNANQYTVDTTSLSPFRNVVVADSNPGQSETVTMILSSAGHGVLSNLDSGSYDAATGVYTVSGTAAEVTAALDSLTFTPTVADQPIRTTFAINVVDSAGDTASNHATAVTSAQPITIATNGLTTLASLGNSNNDNDTYIMENINGSVVAYLTLNGSPVLVNQFSAGWRPIGAKQTGNGYEVAWVSTAGTYVVWNVASNGAFTGDATGVLSATSTELPGLEANFGELGDDGVFPGGPATATPITIATNGTTTLAAVGSLYELNPAGGGTGPLLELHGIAVEAGQFGTAGWAPVGAKQTADGYEVAFGSANGQYVVWNTNTQGDYTSNFTAVVPAGSATIEAVEASFGETFPGAGTPATPVTIATSSATTPASVGNLYEPDPTSVGTGSALDPTVNEDLNGDGMIEPTTVAIGTNGALNQVANQFELVPTGGGTGPLLELNGSAVEVGQFGAAGWTPVGAFQTGNGWEVAFSGTSGYVVWNVNSSGDFIGDATGVVAPGSATIEAVEANFGETFAGAGTPATPITIATNGTTTLAAVGNLYELNPAGGGTGPLLELHGSAVEAGQFGAAGWTPVGAKQTADGYEVAFGGANGQYVVWNTNTEGDYTSNVTAVAPAGSATIEAVEANFGENFGAGTPATPSPIAVNGTNNGLLDAVGDLYELNPSGGGPLLEVHGNAVIAGQFPAGWTPIGVEETATGYEVAWSEPGANGVTQYTVWNTDGNGDYTSSALGVVSGPNFALEDLDPAFDENLNGAPSLSTILETSTAANGTLNLSRQTQNVTIDLGANTASATGQGLNVSSSSSSPTFSGTPFAITLNPSAHEIVEYGLAPSSGIETVANFVVGQDELNIGLRGVPTSLEFVEMTVGGAPAVGIFSSADPSHGVVLLNPGVTAHILQTDYTTTAGGATGQGHALIG